MVCILGKTLLIISGGIEAVPGIQRAKDMGLNVVVSDMNPRAPGFKVADDRIVASTYDIDATVEAAKEYHRNKRLIDGVICMAADIPLTVASVAEELGLPSIPVSVANLSSNKLAMKERFQEAGIPISRFKKIETLEDLHNIINEKKLPLVLKPVDSRGARGVLRITDVEQVKWAFDHSIRFSPTGQLIVEEYLEGPQVSTEAVVIDGIGYSIGFSDRNYEYLDRFSPYIIENGGSFPSYLNLEDQKKISDLAIKASLALGVHTGVVKGDMVLTEEGPKVIEIATRLSGGWLSSDQIPLGLGVDIVGSAIKLALGEKVEKDDLRPKFHKGVAIRYFFPKPGKVKELKNIEHFKNIKWIHRLCLFVKPGDVIEPVTDHTKRAGFVITVADTAELAVNRAENVINTIEIVTDSIV